VTDSTKLVSGKCPGCGDAIAFQPGDGKVAESAECFWEREGGDTIDTVEEEGAA
jgi:hypothetical protein